MMVSRYNKDKKRTPSHMTEGMTDCLKEVFSLIEGVNLVFGQFQGSAEAQQTRGVTGLVNPNTVRSARENVSRAVEECILLDLEAGETESMRDLMNALRQVEQEHPSGVGVPRQMMVKIQEHMGQFINDFLETAVDWGESDPDNLIWGKG